MGLPKSHSRQLSIFMKGLGQKSRFRPQVKPCGPSVHSDDSARKARPTKRSGPLAIRCGLRDAGFLLSQWNGATDPAGHAPIEDGFFDRS